MSVIVVSLGGCPEQVRLPCCPWPTIRHRPTGRLCMVVAVAVAVVAVVTVAFGLHK